MMTVDLNLNMTDKLEEVTLVRCGVAFKFIEEARERGRRKPCLFSFVELKVLVLMRVRLGGMQNHYHICVVIAYTSRLVKEKNNGNYNICSYSF